MPAPNVSVIRKFYCIHIIQTNTHILCNSHAYVRKSCTYQTPKSKSNNIFAKAMQDPNTNKLVISSYLFIRILAAATINFSLAGVWLLIEGGSYLREAIINFGAIDLGDIDTIDSFFMTDFRIFGIDDR